MSHPKLHPHSPEETLVPRHIEEMIRTVKVLVVDDDYNMRKVVRAMLTAIGVREICDAPDGKSGLQAIRTMAPDVVILDWQMPNVSGAEVMRAVRAPGSFPLPNVPVIVLTGHGERACVAEAMQLGANEYLLKPVSIKALFDRLVSVLTRPRPMVRLGGYYGPRPRRAASHFSQAEADAIYAEVTGGPRGTGEPRSAPQQSAVPATGKPEDPSATPAPHIADRDDIVFV
jgi:DNA-binding response OmpR family regulator